MNYSGYSLQDGMYACHYGKVLKGHCRIVDR